MMMGEIIASGCKRKLKLVLGFYLLLVTRGGIHNNLAYGRMIQLRLCRTLCV